MNKIKFILSLVLCIFLFIGGCSDFLNQSPKSFVSPSNFYSDNTQFNEALNGAYSTLQKTYGGGSYWWSDERSDNGTYQFTADSKGPTEIAGAVSDIFTMQPDYGKVEGLWRGMYRGIAQCNAVLDRVGSAGLKEDDQNHIVGQAKFIRSLYYFNLVRLYGGVPLILHQAGSPEDADDNADRVTTKVVYNQIIEDLKDAGEKLPVKWPAEEKGKATKGASFTLLGLVYMTRENFQEAISIFQKIKTMDYELVSDYNSLYEPSNANNVESVFEIQYSSSVTGEGSNYIYSHAPSNSGSDIVGFNDLSPFSAGRNIPTRSMLNAYENGDKRKNASIAWYVDPSSADYAAARGDSMPYVKKFADKPTKPGEQDVNFYVFRYAQVLLWKAEALNEVGNTGQAYPLINKVRERAGLPDLPSGLSQAKFRTAVYHEQRVENAFENHRWFQLLRTGRALDVMRQHAKDIKSYVSILTDDMYNIEPYKLLFPIPAREVRLDNLEQNPGW